MADYFNALKWPIVSWIAVDIVFVLMSYVTGVLDMLTPTVIAPVALAFGLWAGYKIVHMKGHFFDAIAAGVILGVVCAVLTVGGLGVVRGLGVDAVSALSVFALGMNIVGAVIGGGYALTK